ncbi:MAG: septum formation initiator family protein [Chloroflexi bacterium]|nr:septum formation initiator family protein [Chloroflexota bacterium]
MSAPPESGQRKDHRREGQQRGRGSILLRLSVVLVLPLVVYGGLTVFERSIQTYRLVRQEVLVRAEIDALRGENLRLQEALNRAKTDFEIERTAREQLGLIRPGDQPIALVGGEGTRPSQAVPPRPRIEDPVPPPTDDETPPWVRWLQRQFGI